MNFATSPPQIAAGTYLQDSTPNPLHIAPMNFATSRSQVAAGMYLQSYSVSITNTSGKFSRLPLIKYHP